MRRSGLFAAIVLGGGVITGAAHPVAAAATQAEGSLDFGFGSSGMVETVVPGGTSRAQDLAVQPDGKIVVVGAFNATAADQIAVLRYNVDGTLDTTFSSDGIQTAAIGAYCWASAVAVQPDGKIIVAGSSFTGIRDEFAMVRYNPGGTLDTTFSDDGIQTTAINQNQPGDLASSLALQPDGKIVVGGSTHVLGHLVSALARYNPDGTLDTTFSDDGIQTTAIGQDAWATKVLVQHDGKIVAAGSAELASRRFAVARYKPDGTLDTSFSGDGIHTTTIGQNADATSAALQRGGKIVLGGHTVTTGSRHVFALARYSSNGTLDPTFSGDGKQTTAFGDEAYAGSIALQRNGKIVAAGWADITAADDFALARYNLDGSLDPAFGGDGRVTTPVSSSTDRASAVAVQRNGKIIAAGVAFHGVGHIAAVRYVGDATAPTNGHLVGVRRFVTTLTRTLRWTARDDNTGVRSYDVRYRGAGFHASGYGSYGTWQSATTGRSADFTGSPGRTYCFGVRARDRAGNLGAWGVPNCTAFPVNDRTLAVRGSWTDLTARAYYDLTARRSTTSGATLRLRNVSYRHLALVATKAPGHGTVRVYLGAKLLKTISLAAAQVQHRVLIPITASARVKSGDIRLVQASAGKRVVIEGLAVSLA